MSAESLLQNHYYMVDYDTAYISRSPGKIGLKAWGSLSGASLRALEVATNLTGSGGRNRDFEINFNFYPRRFVLDVNYQKARILYGMRI